MIPRKAKAKEDCKRDVWIALRREVEYILWKNGGKMGMGKGRIRWEMGGESMEEKTGNGGHFGGQCGNSVVGTSSIL